MGRIYVKPGEDNPDSKKVEDNPVKSGRIYVGTSDAAGDLIPVVGTDGEIVKISEPLDPNAPPADPSKDDDGDDGEPAGNATTEEWADYARSQGATDEDLVDEDGKALGRTALREKYGSKGD